jgi:hypothetical protein
MWGKHMLMHGHVRIQARGFGNWPTRQWSTVTWGHASSMLHRCKQHCAWYLEQWVRGGGGAPGLAISRGVFVACSQLCVPRKVAVKTASGLVSC